MGPANTPETHQTPPISNIGVKLYLQLLCFFFFSSIRTFHHLRTTVSRGLIHVFTDSLRFAPVFGNYTVRASKKGWIPRLGHKPTVLMGRQRFGTDRSVEPRCLDVLHEDTWFWCEWLRFLGNLLVLNLKTRHWGAVGELFCIPSCPSSSKGIASVMNLCIL